VTRPAERRPAERRPAETAGAGGTIALLVAYVLGVTDPDTVVCLAAAVGLVPAAVTLLVSSEVGGVRGALRLLWRGRTR
jgi:hypothetical protein